MNSREDILKLNDFFKEKTLRNTNVSFMSVINCYSSDVHSFLLDYYKIAIKCGIVIEDKIINPSNEQVSYMNDIIGSDFQLSPDFISSKLKSWIQTLNIAQSRALSESICSVLNDLKLSGKNESALKNAYVKFMCWLYYKFRSLLNQLYNDAIPKILYEGSITSYELYMLEVLSRYGCDVLILDYGTTETVKSDSMFPKVFPVNGTSFPKDFSIKSLKKEFLERQKIDSITAPKSVYKLCKNAWMNDTKINEICRVTRMDDKNFICSSFMKFSGVDDRKSYINDLFQLYNTLIDSKKDVVILEKGVPNITPQEINLLHRINCQNIQDIATFLNQNIRLNDPELTKYAKNIFIDYLKSQANIETNIRKLEEKIVKFLALFYRYSNCLHIKNPGCIFILENQPLKPFDYEFFDLFTSFPVDVIILNPMKIVDNCSSSVLEFVNDDTLSLDKFPIHKVESSYSTTAYNAENDLTEMIYQNTGIYRDRQYDCAEPIVLKTMYEEIEILWKENLSLRPGFSTENNKVILPTIFAKVCGVKNGNKKSYVKSIEKLIMDNPNVLYIRDNFKYNDFYDNSFNPISVNIASVMTNGKVDAKKVKNHKDFKYNYIREETVDFMIDGFSRLIESKVIHGVGSNGAENILFGMFLHLPKDILNMIQNFDFTKINPKLVYVNSTDNILKLEETMLISYLSFIGFDIVLFIPTGYNIIEKYLNKKMFVEHQIGEYIYDFSLNIRKKKGFLPW